jgi:glycosyltransferase involved in cell wall biosynthesis
MKPPLVSVCMPHLNRRPFIEERIETVLRQTCEDWELIIIDSGSDDGSREILERYVTQEPRIRLSQAPRDGIYTNLNRALEVCRGDFIYIAPSDDTMTPHCLERMVDAMQQNPDCGICHCCLEIIDENGVPASGDDAWENWPMQQFFGDWADIAHVRQAPHDGLLHFYCGNVYTSLTQLLVRRRVFHQLGVFRTDCGSRADCEWGMRVGLNENVVHVPEKLATWRRHAEQATRPDDLRLATATGEFHRMVRMAIKSLRSRNPNLAKELRKSTLNYFLLVREFSARQQSNGSVLEKLGAFAAFSVAHPVFSAKWLFTKLVLRRKMTGEFKDALQNEFTRLGIPDLVRSLDHGHVGTGE